jgi:SAM-dependent methyltransferase
MGQTTWDGKVFEWPQCSRCRSLYCSPMPSEEELSKLYSQEYQDSFYSEAVVARARRTAAAKWLKGKPPGTFLDYGCGSGGLLEVAQEMGWKSCGVEFDPKVAAQVAARTQCRVESDPNAWGEPVADVLYLGDVLEHLTRMNEQVPQVLRLLKPGGVLLAQGPLENNASLFASVMANARATTRRVKKLAGRDGPTEHPPYHVMLATAQGQRALFERFGLSPERFEVREISWPAPHRLAPNELKQPRAVALFFLRRLSQAFSRTRSRQWGNWYFYVGRWSG